MACLINYKGKKLTKEEYYMENMLPSAKQTTKTAPKTPAFYDELGLKHNSLTSSGILAINILDKYGKQLDSFTRKELEKLSEDLNNSFPIVIKEVIHKILIDKTKKRTYRDDIWGTAYRDSKHIALSMEMPNIDVFARTLLHENRHARTANQIEDFLNGNLSPASIMYKTVEDINNVYKDVLPLLSKRQIERNYNLHEFVANFLSDKELREQVRSGTSISRFERFLFSIFKLLGLIKGSLPSREGGDELLKFLDENINRISYSTVQNSLTLYNEKGMGLVLSNETLVSDVNISTLKYVYTKKGSDNLMNYNTESDFVRAVNKLSEGDAIFPSKAEGNAATDDDTGGSKTDNTKANFDMFDSIIKRGKQFIRNGETNLYSNKERGGDEYVSVTDSAKGLMSFFLPKNKAKDTEGMSIEERVAHKIWKNKSDSAKLATEFGTMDKAAYIEKLKFVFLKGRTKGKIVHIIVQKFINGDPDGKLDRMLNELYEISGYSPKQFDWVAANIKQVLRKAGTNLFDEHLDESKRDRIVNEVTVAAQELHAAGTMDTLIYHPYDNTYSIIDFKTGYSFNTELYSEIFEYGDQGSGSSLLWWNPRNEAKLQIMLYAFMLKLENPDIKFKNLTALWLPNKDAVYLKDFKAQVEVAPFLRMIEGYLKHERKDIYAAIKDGRSAQEFAQLFDPREYQHGFSAENVKEMEAKDLTQGELLKLKMNRLKLAVYYDMNPHATKSAPGTEARKEEISKLTKEILDLLNQTTDLDLTSWKTDMSFIGSYLHSNRSANSPYIQMYDKLLVEAKERANNQYIVKYAKFRSLLYPIYKAYMKRTGKEWVDRATFGQIPLTNPVNLYEFARVEVYDDEGNLVNMRLRTTKQDWEEAKQKFSYINDSNLNTYKAFVDYINDSYEEFFVDKNGKTALANQVAFEYENEAGFPVKVTNLQLANKEYSGYSSDGVGFEYERGFMPKFAKQMHEIKNMFASSEYWKLWYQKNLTYFEEQTFEQWNNQTEAIPFKGLGNKYLNNNPGAYSWDLEYQFDRFMRATLMKQELDPVYSFGKGVQYMMEMADNNKDNNKIFANTISYMKKALEMQIQNKDQTAQWANRAITKNKKNVSITKLLYSAMKWGAAPIMWFNYVGGLANGTFGALYLAKEGVKNSILKSDFLFPSIDGNEVDFTIKDIAAAQKDITEMLAAAAKGDIYSSKTYLLLRKFNYLPSNWEWISQSSQLMASFNKGLNSSTPYIFYSLPEEWIAATTMVAQLRSMKINNPEAPTFHKKSLWDMYEKIESVDETTGTKHYEIRWVEDPATRKAFVRGLQKVGDEYQEITELNGDEMRRLYHVYERMQGGYRNDERVMIEYYVLGKVFMQFRRYLPNVIRNAMMSSAPRSALGTYKPTGEMKDGKQVMEWTSRIMEGRWAVLGKMMTYYLGARLKTNKEDSDLNWRQRVAHKFLAGRSENYSWDELSAGQKEGVVDAVMTIGIMILGVLGAVAIFGGSDDDDSWYKLYSRILGDLTHQYNFLEMMRNVGNIEATSWKKSYDFFQAAADLTLATGGGLITGDDEMMYTKDGNIRGLKTFLKENPVTAPWRRHIYFWENAGEGSYFGFGF